MAKMLPLRPVPPPLNVAPDRLAAVVRRAATQFAPLLQMGPPYRAGGFLWASREYLYVSGLNRQGERRLIELFLASGGRLAPVLAYQYPPPICTLFPLDAAPLFEDEPWNRSPTPAAPPAQRSPQRSPGAETARPPDFPAL